MLIDLVHAFRVCASNKAWTVVVLTSLAVGIGANAALFSAVNGVLLQPLAVPEPETLVRLAWFGENQMFVSSMEYGYVESDSSELGRSTFSYPMFRELQARSETLSGMVAAAPYGVVSIVVEGEAEIASAFVASGNYFEVLRIGAVAGRTLDASDDRAAARPVAMISYAYWARRFGRDPSVVGRVVSVNRVPMTIVGVTPPGYSGIQHPLAKPADVHLPLALDRELGGGTRLDEPTFWWLQVMGRLEPGATPLQVRGNLEGAFNASARSGMSSYLESLAADELRRSENRDRVSVPRLEVYSGERGIYDPQPDITKNARLLGAVIVLVLFIVCANVATLLLARADARRTEIATRMSLGATRARLMGQLLLESVWIAGLGGAIGFLIALWGRRFLPFGEDAPMDLAVLFFVALLSCATGIAFGVLPALRATDSSPGASLWTQVKSAKNRRSLAGRALVTFQVAMSVILLTGAGLLLSTLRHLRNVDVGFDPTNILVFRLDPGLSGYEGERLETFYRRVRERVGSLERVRSVGFSRHTFLAGSTSFATVHLPGDTGNEYRTYEMTVSPEFLETLNVPLISGRGFSHHDTGDSRRVALVNEAAAEELFGSQPIGRRFGFSPEEANQIEVVGVAGNVRYQSVREAVPSTVFLPYTQRGLGSMMFAIKTVGDPLRLVPDVRDALSAIDPNVPLMGVSTQEEEIEARLKQERYLAISYSLFGALAVLLTAIGLFGLASYEVVRRTREIGIRMALGAQREAVVSMVLRDSMRPVVLGVLIGLLASFAAARVVANLLFGVAPTDAPSVAAAVALVALVAAGSAYVPARRGSRLDPTVALHHD